jgi:hypothetical protein
MRWAACSARSTTAREGDVLGVCESKSLYNIAYLMTRWVGWMAKSLTLSFRNILSSGICSIDFRARTLYFWISVLSSFDFSLIRNGK